MQQAKCGNDLAFRVPFDCPSDYHLGRWQPTCSRDILEKFTSAECTRTWFETLRIIAGTLALVGWIPLEYYTRAFWRAMHKATKPQTKQLSLVGRWVAQ